MAWIFLSPHFDDIALSCGGLAWEQSRAGESVQVWTICAGEAPPGPLSLFAAALHARWEAGQNAPTERRAEDLAACREMGAVPCHFDLPDCIYRRGLDQVSHLYISEEDIFGPIHPEEEGLIARLAEDLEKRRDDAQTHSGAFGLAAMFLQIAILLSSIAALMKRKLFWFIGMGAGVFGLVYFFNGFFLIVK